MAVQNPDIGALANVVGSGQVISVLSTAVTGTSDWFILRAKNRVFYANAVSSAGTGSVSITIQGTCDNGLTWVSVGTISLTPTTTMVADAFTIDAPWPMVRAAVTAISGTGTSTNVFVGV